MIYRRARCNCKLWKALWFNSVFWVLSYIYDDHSCLKCCISFKLSQIMCLIDVNILVCQKAKCYYRLCKIIWINSVVWEFSYIILTIHICVSDLCTNFGVSTYQMLLLIKEGSLIQLRFLGIFIHYFDHLYLNCCVSKLSLILYVINTHTDDISIYQMWLQVLECFLTLKRFLLILHRCQTLPHDTEVTGSNPVMGIDKQFFIFYSIP